MIFIIIIIKYFEIQKYPAIAYILNVFILNSFLNKGSVLFFIDEANIYY